MTFKNTNSLLAHRAPIHHRTETTLALRFLLLPFVVFVVFELELPSAIDDLAVRNSNFISRSSSNILDQHNLISWSFISDHVAKALYQSDLSALKNYSSNIQLDMDFLGGSLPKNTPLKRQSETLPCIVWAWIMNFSWLRFMSRAWGHTRRGYVMCLY